MQELAAELPRPGSRPRTAAPARGSASATPSGRGSWPAPEGGGAARPRAASSCARRSRARRPRRRPGASCWRRCGRGASASRPSSSERAAAELELYPRRERKRAETEWEERIRRARRRVETGALDLALELVALWLLDLAALAWGAPRSGAQLDRLGELRRLRCGARRRRRWRCARRVELVEDTRQRFQLNVSEELALEALDLPARASAGGDDGLTARLDGGSGTGGPSSTVYAAAAARRATSASSSR